MTTTSNPKWTHTGLKPLSVNEAFCGKKVKTAGYRKYENQLIRQLPDLEVPEGLIELRVVVYYSNKRSDIDNCLKPFIDVLQKRYGFDDNRIYRIRITKVIVKKGQETIAFRLLPFTPEPLTVQSELFNGETTNGNEA